MTTPVALPQVKAYTLKPTSTGSGYMPRTDTGANSVPLPPGINTITVSWIGDSGLAFNYRNPGNLVTTLGASLPASVGTRVPRMITLTIAVPVESSGGQLHVSASAATAWDVERVACGVQVINQPKN